MHRALIVAALVAGSFALAPVPSAHAVTFEVTNLDDAGPGSLRQAIVNANALAGLDTITFASDLTGTITLTSAIDVADSVEIVGPGADVLAISGDDVVRTFAVNAADLSVSGLELAHGDSSGAGGAIVVSGGDLTLTSVVLRENSAAFGGGAAVLGGSATISSSEVVDNTAAFGGGLVAVDLIIVDTTIAGNSASVEGGGVFALPAAEVLTISRSTIANNDAGLFGGGVRTVATSEITIDGSTISGNTAGVEGGGLELISPAGTATIETSTITGNSSGGGVGGVGVLAQSVTVRHSTIAGNAAATNWGGLASNGPLVIDHVAISGNTAAGEGPDLFVLAPHTVTASWSLVSDISDTTVTEEGGNVVGVDAALGALAANGGTTETMLPFADSPLIDAGDPEIVGAPDTDQRGARRVVDAAIDIGAVETGTSSRGRRTRVDALEPVVEVFTAEGLDDDADLVIRSFPSHTIGGEARGVELLTYGYTIDVGGDDVDHAVICIPYDPDELEDRHINELDLELFHLPDAGGREVITTTKNEQRNQVCGITTSFSSFVVGALQTDRLAGGGTIDTAAAASAATFEPGVAVAYVASEAGLSDAVAAGGAAAAAGGPLLLTMRDLLPVAVADELVRLAPRRVVVVGGTAAVSDAVLDAVTALGAPVERVAGDDRFETAALLSASAFGAGVASVHVVGADAHADGLVAGAAAARAGGPVLYVDRDGVPEATAAELARLAPDAVVVVGGTAVVSDDVVAALGAARLGGEDRYSTSALLAHEALVGAPVVAVGGEHPTYGIVGVPVAAARHAALVLVRPDEVPVAVGAVIDRIAPTSITVIGGRTVVSRQTESDLAMHLVG